MPRGGLLRLRIRTSDSSAVCEGCGKLPETPSGLRRGDDRAQNVACSDKCRVLKRRRARVPLPVAEAGESRANLTTILETAWAIKARLESYGNR